MFSVTPSCAGVRKSRLDRSTATFKGVRFSPRFAAISIGDSPTLSDQASLYSRTQGASGRGATTPKSYPGSPHSGQESWATKVNYANKEVSRNATPTSHDRTVERRRLRAPARTTLYSSMTFIWPGSGLGIASVSGRRVPVYPLRRKKVRRPEVCMKKTEWLREDLSGWPTPEYLKQKESSGWRLIAAEWERPVEVAPQSGHPEGLGSAEEIPFGTRVAGDCRHLEEDPTEMQVLNQLAEMVVQDLSYN